MSIWNSDDDKDEEYRMLSPNAAAVVGLMAIAGVPFCAAVMLAHDWWPLRVAAGVALALTVAFLATVRVGP